MRTAIDDKDIQFVAVNDVTDAKTLAHLLKYDSVLGNLPHKVTHTDDSISVEGKSFKVFRVKDPAELDWASVGAEIVVESTGLFTKGPDAKKHLERVRANARRMGQLIDDLLNFSRIGRTATRGAACRGRTRSGGRRGAGSRARAGTVGARHRCCSPRRRPPPARRLGSSSKS